MTEIKNSIQLQNTASLKHSNTNPNFWLVHKESTAL